MNESQFRNLVYEMTLKMLNEDDPIAAAAPVPAGAPTDPNAAAGGMAIAAPEDVDKNPYKERADKEKQEIAKKVGDNSGGAPGFSPQGPVDKKTNRINERKKRLARRITNNVMTQVKEQFCK
jgi:hypothetical protein